MKVVVPGVLTFSNFGGVQAHGWAFDSEGDQPTPRELVRAMLMHIAEAYGIDLADECDLTRVTPSVERATLDAIAVMRWPVRDE